MIFISGVHGVGKTHFCQKVKADTGIDSFSASQLISERKNTGFDRDKLIPDIDVNQQYLLMAVQDLNKSNPRFLLDGHFCLLNAEGRVTHISKKTFIDLNPDAIVLLTENPEVIIARRKQRDDINHNVIDVQNFQNEEIAYATEISDALGIPLKITTGVDGLADAIDFIRTIVGG